MKHNHTFLELEKEFSEYQSAKFVVVPCPHEKSTSYGKGTKDGPQAILDASYNVENFDEELKSETYRKVGINTFKPITANRLPVVINKIIKDKKIPIILGGEHSLSPFAIEPVFSKYPNLSVLQFDAHADLRDEYHGDKNSHASAMRRALEICPVVQVGIRNISPEEYTFAQKSGQINKIHFARKPMDIKTILGQLSGRVYISFDVDVFDPSIIPSTGTPEPGGLNWYGILDILREVCRTKEVAAADFVELMPIKRFIAPDFTIAKLIYRLIGYLNKA